jgi:hypothetical protein
MTRLFPIDDIPEVPILRPARKSRGQSDARFQNDYTAAWPTIAFKARVAQEHRCERCGHRHVPNRDAKLLDVPAMPGRWTPCDRRCTHLGPIRLAPAHWDGQGDEPGWREINLDQFGQTAGQAIYDEGPDGREIARWAIEAEWRVLTVHHLDGDKANNRWWNLAVLCQRCHLEIQAKVVMERVYPHEHSEWFKPHAAAYYAFVYLDERLNREKTLARLDELLALELIPG